jgi:hypothetical protein
MAAAIPLQQPGMVNPNPGSDSRVHVQGYPQLSFFFSQCPRYLHLRRFSALAVRLLLYRQHALTLLEKDLLELENKDALHSDPDHRALCHDFGKLESVTPEESLDQKELYKRLKTELKEYGMPIVDFDRIFLLTST